MMCRLPVIRHLDAQRVAVASSFSFEQLDAVWCAVVEPYQRWSALTIDDSDHDCIGAAVLKEMTNRIAQRALAPQTTKLLLKSSKVGHPSRVIRPEHERPGGFSEMPLSVVNALELIVGQ